MSEKVLRKKDVCKKIGLSSTSLWRLQKSGKFPEPSSIEGSSLKGWKESTINKWIDDNYN